MLYLTWIWIIKVSRTDNFIPSSQAHGYQTHIFMFNGTHLHFGFSFCSAGLKVLLLLFGLCFRLSHSGQLWHGVLCVQVSTRRRRRSGDSVISTLNEWKKEKRMKLYITYCLLCTLYAAICYTTALLIPSQIWDHFIHGPRSAGKQTWTASHCHHIPAWRLLKQQKPHLPFFNFASNGKTSSIDILG